MYIFFNGKVTSYTLYLYITDLIYDNKKRRIYYDTLLYKNLNTAYHILIYIYIYNTYINDMHFCALVFIILIHFDIDLLHICLLIILLIYNAILYNITIAYIT